MITNAQKHPRSAGMVQIWVCTCDVVSLPGLVHFMVLDFSSSQSSVPLNARPSRSSSLRCPQYITPLPQFFILQPVYPIFRVHERIYYLMSMCYIPEGPWSSVCAAIQACHRAVHKMGAGRIATDIRIGTRIDRDHPSVGLNERKVKRVEEVLAHKAR